MNRFFYVLLLLFSCYFLSAQSGFRTVTAKGLPSADEVSTNQVSLHNAWFGSSFSYRIAGDQDFNENFLFNANVLYNLDVGVPGWNFPIVGNVTLPVTGGSFEELEISVNPWSIVSKPNSEVILVVHGEIGYSIDPEPTEEFSPQKFNFLGGAEVSIPLGDNSLPLTLSVTPGWEFYNLDRGSNFFIENTFIVPVANNLGLIAEYKWDNEDLPNRTPFSVGILVNGAIGK